MNCNDKYCCLIHRLANKIRLTNYNLVCACLAEMFGTMIFVTFGLGVLVQHNLGKGPNGSFDHGDFLSVAVGWGIAAMLAFFLSIKMGTGSINPAANLPLAFSGYIPFSYVIPYTIVQIVGGWLAGLTVFGVYEDEIRAYDPGLTMEKSGRFFVTTLRLNIKTSLLDQIAVTAFFAAFAFAMLDKNNLKIPKQLVPLYLGIMITGLVTSFALNTGTSINPARDLGPRIALSMVGYGSKAFTYQNGYCWVSIVGPMIGGIIGGFLYEITIGIHLTGAQYEEIEDKTNEIHDDHNDGKENDSDKYTDDGMKVIEAIEPYHKNAQISIKHRSEHDEV